MKNKELITALRQFETSDWISPTFVKIKEKRSDV